MTPVCLCDYAFHQSSIASTPRLPVTGPGDTVLPWAVLVTAVGGLLALASRRRA